MSICGLFRSELLSLCDFSSFFFSLLHKFRVLFLVTDNNRCLRLWCTVDARSIAFDGSAHKVAPRLAPTKEVLSFRAYAARRRLNHLRRASCRLFQSEAVVRVVCRVELEVEQRRLAVRTDRMIHADIGKFSFVVPDYDCLR